jgi:exopolysaccharide biosynthesis polyprenyl glycosylphosphotransferase
MAFEVTTETANYAILQDVSTKDKHQGFQAPFSERRVLLLLGDALVVVLAVFGASLLWHLVTNTSPAATSHTRTHMYWLPFLLGGWWILAGLNDLYHIPSSFDKLTSAIRVAVVGIITLVIFLIALFLIPNNLPHGFFLFFLVIVWPGITLWRWAYSTLFPRPEHRVLIVGLGERGQSVVKILKQASKLNYHVMGYVADNLTTPRAVDDGLPVVGEAAELPYLVRQLRIHEVIVAIDQGLRNNLFEWLVECQANGVRVSLMSDLYEKLCRKIPVEYIDSNWAVHMMQDRPIFNRLDLAFKRLLDVALAIVGILFLIPFVPLLALAIRLDSPGPIFYRQTRCGRAGRPFTIIKFRTMTTNAEQDGKPRWAAKNDNRITRVGQFMRKTRVDELPQLINILRGEMSIIGPRPERPEFVEELQQKIPFYRTRLMVKPGLTGWAQIHYDYGSSVEDALIKLQYDFYYVRYWSLWLDLYIIFRTISVVFRLKGT